MTGRTKRSRRASARASRAAPRDSEEEGDEEGTRTDEEIVPKKRDKGKGRAVEVLDSDVEEEEELESSEDNVSDYEESRKTAKKRKGVGKKGGKGGAASTAKKGGRKGKNVGRLEVMKTLPLELLVEIFSHLDPNDLLALSMVNKQYRSLLASPAYQSVWQESRSRLGLPDVTSGGFTEFQYAHLMFGKRCQSCNSPYAKRADFGIRQRLCKACRNVKIVRLDWQNETLKHVHPLTKDCVLPALHSQNDVRYLARAPYALLADVEHYSNNLWELEYEDEAEQETAALIALTSDSGSPSAIRARGAKISYSGLDSDDDTKNKKDAVFSSNSEGVRAFVAQREPIRQQFRKDGELMRLAENDLRDKLREREVSRFKGDNFGRSMERANEIEARILEHDEEIDEDLFLDYDWFCDKLVFQPKPLTDEEWDLIKDDVCKLVQRISRKRARESVTKTRQGRQEALRPRYDRLKETLDAKARPFTPLFVDFLLFESVRPLWESNEVTVTDKLWATKVDSINEELEQYRLDLRIHARQVILTATMDPDDPQTKAELDKPVEEADLGNAFFSRATSFVCCSFTNCARPLIWTLARTLTPNPDETDSIGPLFDVLKHQHISHNFDNFVKTEKALTEGPRFHINLPLEIACAMSAVIELSGLDDKTAGIKQLRRFERKAHPFEWKWENSTCGHRRFWSWFKLLRKIKVEADKAARNKPPLALEPPQIVLRQWAYKLLSKVTLASPSSTSDEDSTDSTDCAPTRSRKRKVVDSSDSDASSDDDGGRATVKAEPSDDHSFRGVSNDEDDDVDGEDGLSRGGGRSRRVVADSDVEEDDDEESG